MERIRMPREKRAAQFAPFDALKGLGEALRVKEYQCERVQQGDLSEEKVKEISDAMLKIDKKTRVKLVYFEDGHNHSLTGNIVFEFEKQQLKMAGKNIRFDQIVDLQILQKCE